MLVVFDCLNGCHCLEIVSWVAFVSWVPIHLCAMLRVDFCAIFHQMPNGAAVGGPWFSMTVWILNTKNALLGGAACGVSCCAVFACRIQVVVKN